MTGSFSRQTAYAPIAEFIVDVFNVNHGHAYALAAPQSDEWLNCLTKVLVRENDEVCAVTGRIPIEGYWPRLMKDDPTVHRQKRSACECRRQALEPYCITRGRWTGYLGYVNR